eukprot:COSAG02_NODE_452_length_22047_cov_20.154502_8_plen_1865_part_00
MVWRDVGCHLWQPAAELCEGGGCGCAVPAGAGGWLRRGGASASIRALFELERAAGSGSRQGSSGAMVGAARRSGRRRQGEWLLALLVIAEVDCGWSQSPCDGYDCGHGTCSGNKHCTCSGGWSGPTCAVDPCTGYDCGHGTCSGNKHCTCSGGWSGNACNHPTGCDSHPCEHGGTCTANGGDYSCECRGTGYEDPNCATPRQCSGSPVVPLAPGLKEISDSGHPAKHFPSVVTVKCKDKHAHIVGDNEWRCDPSTGKYIPKNIDTATSASCTKCDAQGNAGLLPPNCPADNFVCPSKWDHKFAPPHWIVQNQCTECEMGYGGPKGAGAEGCSPVHCKKLQLQHGKIEYKMKGKPLAPNQDPVFSGTQGHELTIATFACDDGYQLSYDGLSKSNQKITACQIDGSWSGMTQTPTCMRTCQPDAGGSGPCTADSPPTEEANRHYAGCYDGDQSKKFLCQCKLGWKGERCEVDVNECTDTTYAESSDVACVDSTDIAKPRTQVKAYSLQAGLSCSQPYWMSADSGKLPSGCDRDSDGNPLTSCTNLHGSWTCGECTVVANHPELSCCDGSVTMALPEVSHLHPSAPWHYNNSADTNYFQCDITNHGGGKSKQCTPNSNYEPAGACTGPPSASRSTMSVVNSTACTATGGLCTCTTCNLTGFPSGVPGTQCSPAGDGDGRRISIDPYDTSGRKTAENGVTDSKSFRIVIRRQDSTAWNSNFITEDRPVCTAPAINWAGAQSLSYTASFNCNIAGRYEISSNPAIGPDTQDLIGITIITLVPQQADPSTTLAFLANQNAQWCTGAPGKAPRCRTKKGHPNQVLVVVRDRFGNPRPGIEAAEDYVTWSTKVEDSDDPVPSSRAMWDDQRLAYVANFTFTENFAFVFVLELKVNGQSWPAIPSNSTVWQYNLPKDAEKKPLSPLSSRTVFTYRLYMSLNSQKCDDSSCDDAYLSPIDFHSKKNEVSSCSLAGCLFHAGTDTGDINTFHVLADWGVSSDSSSEPTISVSVERVCDIERNQQLYWQTKKACAGPDGHYTDSTTWHYTDSTYDTIQLNRQPSPQAPTGSWIHGSYNGTVHLNVLHPGIFRVQATLTFADGSKDTADMNISVAPGPVSPAHTELHMVYVDPESSYGAVKGSTDWQSAGSAGFADLGNTDSEHGSPYVPQLNLTIYAKDKDKNPRIGRDQVVIKLYRPFRSPVNSKFLDKSYEYQAFVSDNEAKNAGMPRCDEYHGDCRYWKTPDICGADCSSSSGGSFPMYRGTLDNGTYSLTYNFKQFGVYQLSAWICGGDDITGCQQQPENDRARVARLITAPGMSILNSGGKPTRTYNFTVCPQNTEIPETEHLNDHTFDANTINPTDAKSRGAIRGAHLEFCKCKKGFSGNQPQGVICYACEKGKYQNHAGVGACTDCAAGTRCGCSIKESMINVEPTQCKDQASWSPACSECESCAAGRYQNQKGQEDCNTCQTKDGNSAGFYCPAHSAYPMAKPGFWVSSQITASKEVQMLHCAPMIGEEKTIVPKNIVPDAKSSDPLVKVHGAAWCPGTPLSGWTRDPDNPNEWHRNWKCERDCDRPSISPEELRNWTSSWTDWEAAAGSLSTGGRTPWEALSTDQQEQCYKTYHENGLNLGDACLQIVGSRCRTGHKTTQTDRPCAVCCLKGETGGPGSKYADCDGNEWYMAQDITTGESYCHLCPPRTKLTTTQWMCGSLCTIIVVALLMKYGLDLAHKFRALKPPMMTIITFMQVVELFRKHAKQDGDPGTGMRWPHVWEGLLSYLSDLGTIFNLGIPQWISDLVPHIQNVFTEVTPQCLFVLPYWQKWMLWMLSPMLLLIAMRVYYLMRILLAKSAVYLQDRLDVNQQVCEECQKQHNVSNLCR